MGALLILGGLYAWVFEPPDDPEAHAHDDHHDGDTPDDGDNGAPGDGTSTNGEE